jgi:phospholipase/lecithinase/hemolysin
VIAGSQALGIVWVGQNDLSEHTDAFWLDDPHNGWFAGNYSARSVAAAQALLAQPDVSAVLVVNLYPKHLAPVTAKYLCGAADNACVQTWGQVIEEANAALQQSLQAMGSSSSSQVIYYDVFSFLTGLLADAQASGFTKPLTAFCDGDGDAAWQDCMVDGNAPEYFWMNFIQPTTRVHQLIAEDMLKTVNSHFGL